MAEKNKAFEQARRQAFEQASKAERERCRAIIRSPEAVDRQNYAYHLALETDMSVDEARRHLAGLPLGGPIMPRPRQSGGVFSNPPQSMTKAQLDALWARAIAKANSEH